MAGKNSKKRKKSNQKSRGASGKKNTSSVQGRYESIRFPNGMTFEDWDSLPDFGPNLKRIETTPEVIELLDKIESSADRDLEENWEENFVQDLLHQWLIQDGPDPVMIRLLERMNSGMLYSRIRDLDEDILYDLWHAWVSHGALPMGFDPREEVHHPLFEKSYQALEPYMKRTHIQSIENRQLREAAAQAEMDLEYMWIPFGWIEKISPVDLGGYNQGVAARQERKVQTFQELPADLQRRLNRCTWNSRARGQNGLPSGEVIKEIDTLHDVSREYMAPFILEVDQQFLEETDDVDALYRMLVQLYIRTAYNCYDGPMMQYQLSSYMNRYEEVMQAQLNPHSCSVTVRQDYGDDGKEFMEWLLKQMQASPESAAEPEPIAEMDYPYLLQCQNCHAIFGRQRRSKVIQHPELYRCSHCGGDLKRIR